MASKEIIFVTKIVIKCFEDRTQNCGNTGNFKEIYLVMPLAKRKQFCVSSFCLCKIHFEILDPRH